MDDDQDNGERISVSIGGAQPSAPVAPRVDTPAEPEEPAEGAGSPVEPRFAPPAPGSVVTGDDGIIGGPPPSSQVVTSDRGGRGRRWLKRLLIILLLAALVAGGWFAYQKWFKKKPAAAPATVHSKDIPSLKVGVQSADFGKLYPNMSVNDYAYTTNAQMFEGLVRYENVSKIVPDLASNWKNPDSKTWIFTIKKDIKFHDGHTLAPSDVKYSLDKIITGNPDFAQTFAGTIASVDLVGDDQVKIITKDPDPTLLNKLTFLYVIDANLPKGAEPSQAGTGPYEIKPGTTPTDNDVQMVAFDAYHDGRPYTRSLSFGSINDPSDPIKDFEAHQYDIVGDVSPDKAKSVAANHFVTNGPDVNFIGFNTVKPGPLQKKLVREAIRYAVDPAAIGKANDSNVTPLSQMVPPSVPGYNPSIAAYKTDPAKAKQLLAQAGYPKGLTLRFSVAADAQQTTGEVVNELKAAGITLKVDSHSNFDEFINYFSGGKAEMFTVDYTSDTLDGVDIYNTTISSANYNNPELTDLLSQASTTVDPAKRLKLLQQAAAIIDKDVAVVPLSTQSYLWLMNKAYVIKQDMPSASLPVYFYKVHN
jgi:peptide/nickel transport system substrate-binding protein